jgi:hypothetical protein
LDGPRIIKISKTQTGRQISMENIYMKNIIEELDEQEEEQSERFNYCDMPSLYSKIDYKAKFERRCEHDTTY